MESLLKGVHHITLCVGGAQQDVDFFTKVLGQRMVKQTVLMDGSIPIYHLYYANADVELGSVATSLTSIGRCSATAEPRIPSPTFSVYASAAELTFGSWSPTNAIGSRSSPSRRTTRQLW